MNSDRCGNTNGQKCHETGSRKAIKIRKFVCSRDAKMHDHTGNNWSHRHSNKRVKEKLRRPLGKRSVASLQETAVLGTSQIIRKGLHSET